MKRIGHEYTIKETAGGRFQVLMIFSEHDTWGEAIDLMLKAINQESSESPRR